MDIYHRYGKKTEQLEQTIEEYLKTLQLLKAIKDGEVDIAEVEITGNSWRVKKKDG